MFPHNKDIDQTQLTDSQTEGQMQGQTARLDLLNKICMKSSMNINLIIGLFQVPKYNCDRW